jgi:hypothetical protein
VFATRILHRSTFRNLICALPLLGALASPLVAEPAFAATADVVNVPGLNSTTRLVAVGPGSFFTSEKVQTFTAQQTGNLVGIWIAAACSNCGTDPNAFVNVHVKTASDDDLLDPALSTWDGGNSGNLQYLSLGTPMHVDAGESVSLTFGCSPNSPTCLSNLKLLATGDQYSGGGLSDMTNGVTTPLNADLVFISEMDNVVTALPTAPQASAPTAAPPTRVNDTDPGIHYSGSSWGYYTNRGVGDLGDDVHATLNNGDSAAYTFTGTAVSYVTEKSIDEGSVDVSIDGVLQQTVNAQSADHNLANQTLYSISGLPQGTHTISVTKRSGTYMLLDYFSVRADGQTVNDTDPGLHYAGSAWGYYPNRPASLDDYQKDVHATLNNGDSVAYTFNGTGISYITEKSLDEGTVDVYVDGVYEGSVNAYEAGTHNQGGQVLFSTTNLARGQHTLKLVKTSGQYMLVDALTVQP